MSYVLTTGKTKGGPIVVFIAETRPRFNLPVEAGGDRSLLATHDATDARDADEGNGDNQTLDMDKMIGQKHCRKWAQRVR